jgi:hypothetical protein
VVLAARIAKSYGLVSRVMVIQNVSCSNWIHCVVKINNRYFDNMILQGQFEQVQLDPGLKYKLIDIPEIHPGMNRKDILMMVSKS